MFIAIKWNLWTRALGFPADEVSRTGADRQTETGEGQTGTDPNLPLGPQCSRVPSLFAERSPAPVQRVNRALQIIRPVAGNFAAPSLSVIGMPGKKAIKKTWHGHLSEDCRDGTAAKPVFAVPPLCCCNDRTSRHLRLDDRWNRAWRTGKPAARPIELRCVCRGQLHHCHRNIAVLVNELGAQRIREAANGMFGAAIGGLERNAAISQRGTHLGDGAAIPRPHMTQRCHGSVNVAEVSDVSNAREFLMRHLRKW